MRLVKPKRVPQGDAEQFLPWQGGVMALRHENVLHNAHLAEGGMLMVRYLFLSRVLLFLRCFYLLQVRLNAFLTAHNNLENLLKYVLLLVQTCLHTTRKIVAMLI